MCRLAFMALDCRINKKEASFAWFTCSTIKISQKQTSSAIRLTMDHQIIDTILTKNDEPSFLIRDFYGHFPVSLINST